MIEPIRYDSGKVKTMKTASSTTIAKFDILDFASGYVQRATSGTSEARFMALEDKVTAADAHEDIQCLYLDGVECEGDTAGTMSQAKVGTYIDLTDHDTLNEAASSNDVFYVTKMVGAQKAQGYFVMKNS